ncbi:hypothetical protein TorRG33x02_350930, partial [Trema orientale]
KIVQKKVILAQVNSIHVLFSEFQEITASQSLPTKKVQVHNEMVRRMMSGCAVCRVPCAVCRVRVVSKDSFELLEGVMSFFLVNKNDNSSFILASKSGGCNLSA